MDNTPARILTVEDAVLIAQLVTGVTSSARVKWTSDGGDTIREGILRRVGSYDGHREVATGAQDVRDMHVHISTSTGVETWLLVSDIVTLMRERDFTVKSALPTLT